MAISQSIASFLLPNQRRRRATEGGGGRPSYDDPALTKVMGEVEEVLEGLNAPSHVAEFIKDDLEDAFTAKSVRAPAYAPSAPPPVKVSLLGLVTSPSRTIGKLVESPFKRWSDVIDISGDLNKWVDDGIWDYLYNRRWVGSDGNSVVPYSFQKAINAYNARTGVRASREPAFRGIFENPGFNLMLAQRLASYYASPLDKTYIGKSSLREIIDKSQAWEAVLANGLRRAGAAKEAGDMKTYNKILADVEKAHKDYAVDSKGYRADLLKEFDRAVKGDKSLALTPEAQSLRFLRNRNLYHSTLNFLKTYDKDGVWGVVKVYGWQNVKKWVGLTKLADWSRDHVLGPLGLNKLAQFAFNAKQFVKDVVGKYTKKILLSLIEKVGLKALLTTVGAALGSVVPGLGNAVGAIVGAAVQFVAEKIVDKLGGVLKIVGYTLAGALGFVVVLGIGIVTLISIILSNKPYPWEQGGSAAAAQRFVQIEVMACNTAAGCSYQNPLRVSNGQHSIGWRVTIRNISSGTLSGSEFAFSQPQCAGAGASGFDLAAGATRVVTCSGSFTETDEVVSNTVSFASAQPLASEEAVGIVIFGNPPVTIPTGWPISHGCITQGPNGSYSHNSTQAIDIGSVSTGTAVRATFNGVVQTSCWESGDGCDPDGYGNYVRVNSLDGSFGAIFAHLASTSVAGGDRVTIGQQLGTVDNTGNSSGTHLHYEFRSLPMVEPYIPRDSGGNGSINGCSEAKECSLCF
jgi:hypothetical protein